MALTDGKLKELLLFSMQGVQTEVVLESVPMVIAELLDRRARTRRKETLPEAPESTIVEIPYPKVIAYLNASTGKRYEVTEGHKRLIHARWKEGATLEDFIEVIDNKTRQWGGDPKMDKYLRPITLFGPKFDAYKNEGGSDATQGFRPGNGGRIQENHRVSRKGKYDHLGTTIEVSDVPAGTGPDMPPNDDIPF